MKLRSDSRMQAAKTVIPLMLPDTHAMYVRAELLLWHVELITVLGSAISATLPQLSSAYLKS